MPLARLVVIAIMVSLCATCAQSQMPNTPPRANAPLAQPEDGIAEDLFPQPLLSQGDINPQFLEDVKANSPESDQTGAAARDLSKLGDCYRIASYRVKRDSPSSDSTHIVSYATCIPVERFRFNTATGRTGDVIRLAP
jgi:hypothetical protein